MSGGLGELHEQAVVAPDDGQLVGHPQAGLPGRPDDPEGDDVRAAQDAGDPALEEALRGHHPALHGVRRALDEVVQAQVVGHQAARDQAGAERRGLALDRDVTGLTQGDADAAVAHVGEVLEPELDAGRVVGGHEVGRDLRHQAVDQDDRQAEVDQAEVPVGMAAGDGVVARDEDDPRDGVLQEDLDVVVLVHPAERLAAQHRRVAVPAQVRLHQVGEPREERVLQLGHHETDQPDRPRPQAVRAVVAEHVDGGQHLPTRVLVDAGLLVEDATDRAHADASALRDLRQPDCHAGHPSDLRHILKLLAALFPS